MKKPARLPRALRMVVLSGLVATVLTSAAAAQTVETLISGIPSNGDVAVDPQGNCYVSAERTDAVIRKITPEGVASVFATGMGQSLGMAFNAAGDTLYVVRSSLAGPIRKVAPDGTHTLLANGFNQPTGLAVGPSGDVYVTDAASVTRVAPDGTKTVLTSDPVLNRPHGVAVDENETVWVASAHDGNIYRLDQDGPVTVTWFTHVDGLQQAWACGYMHYHDGALYITNGDNKTHRIPTATGEVQDWAGNGNWGWVDGDAISSEFMAPNGIYVTPDGRVFLSEYGVQRIRIIEPPATSVGAAAGDDRAALAAGRPNPFAARTVIDFSLPSSGEVRVDVYDVAGRRVRTLLRSERGAGTHQVAWDGRDDAGSRMAAGVYLYRLEAEGVSETRRVTLLR